MSSSQPRVISVRSGRVRPSGSWLYVWLDTTTGDIVHVGGTGFDPELRTYLHMTSDDPEIGRVRATVPQFGERDFDVLAFDLADGIDRQHAKDALIAALSDAAEEDESERGVGKLPPVIDPIVQEISEHRLRLTTARD